MIKKVWYLTAALVLSSVALTPVLLHAEANLKQPTSNDPEKSPNMKEPVSKVTNKPPAEVEKEAKIGTMHNPYTGNAEMIAEGKKAFNGAGCPGCHGGGGGGGMCPSVKNETFVYGSDDDTLFRLIVLGSKSLQEKGYIRKGQENIVGLMPGFSFLKSDDEVFKIIAYIHSLYQGPKDHVNW